MKKYCALVFMLSVCICVTFGGVIVSPGVLAVDYTAASAQTTNMTFSLSDLGGDYESDVGTFSFDLTLVAKDSAGDLVKFKSIDNNGVSSGSQLKNSASITFTISEVLGLHAGDELVFDNVQLRYFTSAKFGSVNINGFTLDTPEAQDASNWYVDDLFPSAGVSDVLKFDETKFTDGTEQTVNGLYIKTLSIAAVPEPATISMIGFIATGLFFFRRRLMR